MIFSIRVGLPSNLRGRIWEYTVKVSKYNSNPEERYEDYLNAECTDGSDIVISKDILRTFPRDKRHKEDWKLGNNKLYNVLKAYSNYDPEVRYCQGMNFIVFIFLKNLDQDQERAFWLLVAMMKEK